MQCVSSKTIGSVYRTERVVGDENGAPGVGELGWGESSVAISQEALEREREKEISRYRIETKFTTQTDNGRASKWEYAQIDYN